MQKDEQIIKTMLMNSLQILTQIDCYIVKELTMNTQHYNCLV